ncbi:MAG: mannose-1-phosphate guanylyltransferase [Lachnospiraceae bacterium]
MKKTALIMAGGKGERFWPKSRKQLPKQFLSLTDNKKTMIQLTVERINGIVDIEDVYIATNREYKSLVQEQLPDIPEENILCEPVGRNTAPCIGLGAIHMAEKLEEALMIVLPSDHLIGNNEKFIQTLLEACEIAEEDSNIVTVGIKPEHPETGYGYIRFDPEKKKGSAFEVDRFVEKPSYQLAEEYVKSGEYFWNSGMFVWKLSTILKNLEIFLPEIYSGLLDIQRAIGSMQEQEVLESVFRSFRSESIDYGVMEKAEKIYIIHGQFDWDDVGSWLALERIRNKDEDGNVIIGNVIPVNTRNCIIQGENKLIAAVGMEDTVIVDTEDAILICNKNNTNQIREILEQLHLKNMEQQI